MKKVLTLLLFLCVLNKIVYAINYTLEEIQSDPSYAVVVNGNKVVITVIAPEGLLAVRYKYIRQVAQNDGSRAYYIEKNGKETRVKTDHFTLVDKVKTSVFIEKLKKGLRR